MSAAPGSENPVPIHVVLDFDGTITKEDTISTLVDIALPHQKSLGQNKDQEWAEILSTYSKAYTSLPKSPNSPFLSSLPHLKALEYTSINQISKSQIFKDLKPEVLFSGASKALENQKLKIRPGFPDFIHAVRNQQGMNGEGKLGIVSVNWCDEWIKAVLMVAGIELSEGKNGVPISSNRINSETGEILGPKKELGWPFFPKIRNPGDDEAPTMEPLLTTADEKLLAIKTLQLRSQYPNSSYTPETTNSVQTSTIPQYPAPNLRTPSYLVYIADSTTDLDSLLVADIGIVMISDSTPKLKAELERLGYKWLPVGELGKGWRDKWGYGGWLERRHEAVREGKGEDMNIGTGREKGREKVMFWAEDFNQVLESGLFE